MKIVSALITDMPSSLFAKLPVVYVTVDDGREFRLFDYYPDEISFTPSEFIGLTLEQATNLKGEKDRAWLRSG